MSLQIFLNHKIMSIPEFVHIFNDFSYLYFKPVKNNNYANILESQA